MIDTLWGGRGVSGLPPSSKLCIFLQCPTNVDLDLNAIGHYKQKVKVSEKIHCHEQAMKIYSVHREKYKCENFTNLKTLVIFFTVSINSMFDNLLCKLCEVRTLRTAVNHDSAEMETNLKCVKRGL